MEIHFSLRAGTRSSADQISTHCHNWDRLQAIILKTLNTNLYLNIFIYTHSSVVLAYSYYAFLFNYEKLNEKLSVVQLLRSQAKLSYIASILFAHVNFTHVGA